MRPMPGQSYPLGATWDGLGVNFALFSEHATRVELCLFDSPDATLESRRIVMPEYNGSFPGILKLLFDTTDIKRCWWHKKAALVGVASCRGIRNLLRLNWSGNQILPQEVSLCRYSLTSG